MTVHQRNCCILLYNFLRNQVLCDEISEDIIICGIDTYFQYRLIVDKKISDISLTSQEVAFLNPLFYQNEKLLIVLSFEINKLFNRKNEIIDNDMFNCNAVYFNLIDFLLSENDCKKNYGYNGEILDCKMPKFKNKVLS